MKWNLKKCLAAAPLILVFGFLCCTPAMAKPSGHLDWADRHTIAGWAWDTASPDQTIEVTIDITPEGSSTSVKTFTVAAESYRGDLISGTNNGYHGFFCPVDWTQLPGDSFTITACIQSEDDRIPLTGTISYDISTEGAVPAVVPTAEETVSGTDSADDSSDPLSASGPLDSLPSKSSSVNPEDPEDSTTASNQTENTADDPDTGKEETEKAGSPSGPLDPTPEPSSMEETSAGSGWKKGESLGYFTTTGYCNCSICSSGWGRTYSGTIPQANHTISADINVLPIGTHVMINGIVYTVEDIGSGVNGNHIDIYYASHAEAEAHGTKSEEVFTVTAE